MEPYEESALEPFEESDLEPFDEEPLAENRLTVTKELFYEGMLRVIKEGYDPFRKKILAALAVAWVVLAAVTLTGSRRIGYLVVAFVVVVLIGVWLSVLVPRNKAKKAWTAMENNSGGEMGRVTRFYSGFLEADNGIQAITVLYDDIRQILHTEHLMVLLSVEKVGIMVARDGFVSGSLAEVQAMIEEEMNAAP